MRRVRASDLRSPPPSSGAHPADAEEAEEQSEGRKGNNKLPVDRVLPTPDEAEWASHTWNMGAALGFVFEAAREDIRESVRKLKELHTEEIQQYNDCW